MAKILRVLFSVIFPVLVFGSVGCGGGGGSGGGGGDVTPSGEQNTVISIILTSPNAPDSYQSGNTVTIEWTTTHAGPSDQIVISMKRDSVAASETEPDDINWYRFTEHGASPLNDGIEQVTIPDGATIADGWRFYVRHTDSDTWDSSDQTFSYTSSVPYIELTEVWNSASIDQAYKPGRKGMDIVGSYLYVFGGESYGQFHIFDVTDPESPGHLATLDETYQIGWYPGNLTVVGNYAYSASSYIVDVTNRSSPIVLAYDLESNNDLFEVVQEGNYIYTIDQSDGVNIYDISTPTNPSLVKNYTSYTIEARYPYGIDVKNNIIYLCDTDASGFFIIDTTDKGNPVTRGSISGECYDVLVNGSYAYVGHYQGSKVVDITDLDNPVQVGTFGGAMEGGLAINEDGNLLFTGGDWDGIKVYDLTNPTTPQLLLSKSASGRAFKVKVLGDYLYVAFDNYAVRIFRITGM